MIVLTWVLVGTNSLAKAFRGTLPNYINFLNNFFLVAIWKIKKSDYS